VTPPNPISRLRFIVYGVVQGVGFRPFVYRLANELSLFGWVRNDAQGVTIEVEGSADRLASFRERLPDEKPPHSAIYSLEAVQLEPAGYESFTIISSQPSAISHQPSAIILPDIATCPDCLNELFNPADRRHHYPFINCTHCGPRYSIITALPYDRPNTTMAGFQMCDACRAEYDNPADRRFHAQPIACANCGPQLELWNPRGEVLNISHDALLAAAEAIRSGMVVAVKGLGGFHLMVDARERNDDAVTRLRRLKRREEKPFALMYPSLAAIEGDCVVDPIAHNILLSPASPILLLPKRSAISDSPLPSSPKIRKRGGIKHSSAHPLSPLIAPSNPYLGVMLPYTPLHHLLMMELGFPVVATSGNLSEEPICTDERDALERLAGIADLFLVHNRPITRHVDDSIVRIMMGREMLLRRARGYAPLPMVLKQPMPPLLAVGGHLKNTIAVASSDKVFVSQHIGDLETAAAYDALTRASADLQRMYAVQPKLIACDRHPDYLSTQFARESGLPNVPVQHHLAHILACMAENELTGEALGVAWDGAGYGDDGTVWGGEFLKVNLPDCNGAVECCRVAHLRTFPLPGGDQAAREPRRSALGLLYGLFGADSFKMTDLPPIKAFNSHELPIIAAALEKRLNCPITSSAGRLFDAVASLLDLRQFNRYEGQAAMELEFLAMQSGEETAYHLNLPAAHYHKDSRTNEPLVLDFRPVICDIIDDLKSSVSGPTIARRFHNTLVEMIIGVARLIGIPAVFLSGGCFQNRLLLESAVHSLQTANFHPYWHQRIPPNDGGIALGQAVYASRIAR
jgi:hydrogenase maturation protein HypF